MTTAADREEFLMEMYRAFNARDIDGALANLAPEVDWPNGWKGGRIHGRAAVRAYWQRQWAEIDPRVEPVKIDAASDGRLHVRVDQLIRDKAGKIIANGPVEHVYTFDGAFIRRMDIVELPPDNEDEDDED